MSEAGKEVLSLSLSLPRFCSLFPGEPGLASFIEAKDDGSDGAIRCAQLQSKCHHQHPTFYMPEALPVAQASVKALQAYQAKKCYLS